MCTGARVYVSRPKKRCKSFSCTGGGQSQQEPGICRIKIKKDNPNYPKHLHSLEIPFEKSGQDYYILSLLYTGLCLWAALGLRVHIHLLNYQSYNKTGHPAFLSNVVFVFNLASPIKIVSCLKES